ncbi:hypothetical protein [Paenibacillus agri]|nr:hypothetical protein [Paenibacillus agri]
MSVDEDDVTSYIQESYNRDIQTMSDVRIAASVGAHLTDQILTA